MEIQETENQLRIDGNHSNGKFSIEIGKQKDPLWTDNKIQMRFEDADSDVYMNMSIEELKTLVEMINKVIENEN